MRLSTMKDEILKSIILKRNKDEHLSSKFFFYSFTPYLSTEEENDGSFCWHGCDKVSKFIKDNTTIDMFRVGG